MSESNFKKQYEILWIKAKQDLVLVAQIISNSEIASEIKYFHLQQGAEKALKSLLCIKGIEFPKTHDLEDLIELAEERQVRLPEYVNVFTELQLSSGMP